MKKEKLFKILTLINGVYSTSWNMIIQLSDEIKDDNATIIEKNWGDSFKNENYDMFPLDLSDRKTWSTFDGTCIDLKFVNINNKLTCIAKIYNGDTFDGHRKDLRFTATIELKNNFIFNIKNNILNGYENFLEKEYKNYLEKQKELWINKMREKFIK